MERKPTNLRLNGILAQIMEFVVGTPHNSTFPRFSDIAELRHSDLKLIFLFGNCKFKLRTDCWLNIRKIYMLALNLPKVLSKNSRAFLNLIQLKIYRYGTFFWRIVQIARNGKSLTI